MQPDAEIPEEEVSVRDLWQEAVGKVLKLATKSYGNRKVTYTQIKGVRDTDRAGNFEIDVLCVEIVGRVLDGKRTHSNICKEGVLSQTPDSDLLPDNFGEECPMHEFEKVTDAILAYTNTYLDWVMQDAPEDETAIEIPVDLPHFRLTGMEASLVRNSPFLVKDLYIVTPNSIRAAFASIQQELLRGSRNMLLVDAVDPIYVAQKNEAADTLRAKLHEAQLSAAAVRKDTAVAAMHLDSLSLALLGKPSATTLSWVTANPSEEGAVFHLGMARAPLEFVRWVHTSGRMIPQEMMTKRNVRDYFKGWNDSYTGPDADGFYPLLRPATD